MSSKLSINQQDLKYLQLLAQSFPNVSEASTEIINLQAILNLPKGTEHFLADGNPPFSLSTIFILSSFA